MKQTLYRGLGLFLAIFMTLNVVRGVAQSHPALQHTTIKLGSSDSIDLDTLNLQLSFPIVNKAGRGVGVRFAVSYYGNFWKPGQYSGQGWTADYNYGWNFQPAQTLGSFSEQEFDPYICALGNSTQDALYTHRYGNRMYIDPIGISHVFGGERSYSECTDSETESYPDWTSSDGYSINAGNYLYDPSGIRVATASVHDSNGNTYFAGGADTTGTTPLAATGLSGTGVDGISVVYTYKDSQGSDQHVTVNFSYFNVRSAFGSGVTEKVQSNAKLPTSIVYPDGQYLFTYESTPGYSGWTTARIASITLPTGGVIAYDYSGGSVSTDDGSISKLTRTTSDGATVYTRTTSDPLVSPAYGPPMTAHVTVAPPVGNQTTYTFSGSWFNLWSTAGTYLYVPTAISDGVTTRSICYRFSSHVFSGASDGSCAQSDLGYPILGRETTTTFDNNMTQVVKETYDANGVLTASSTSDISSTTPQVLATTQTTYATFNSIHDRPSNRIVKDGSGSTVSYVDYAYDQNSLSGTTGLTGREYVFGDRGNLTHVTYNGSISESFWYDDAGQLVKKQDPSGNYTNYQRDSTDTFLTETDLPTTVSGQSLALKSNYDVSSGLLISQTDANNHKTTFNYDASLRQTTRTRDTASGGDGGVISRTYVSSKQISITSPNGNGGTADVEQIADDYGRPIRAARKIVSTSGRPWVITDTCYDANGRVFFKSLPYTAANLTGSQVCSGSGDTISYDGIGRTHSITHSDGSTVDYVYKGRATKVTEESNGSTRVAKITQVDGLGRITAVCELSNTALVRGGMTFSPQLCGLDVDSSSAVGFLTTYSYNLAAHTTTSTQGSGSNTQTRTWTTDAFGRPTSESIPEAQGKDVSGATGSTGITTYAYDYNSTGLKVTRTKPQANILSGSTVTTTETQFDALGRPQSIQYRTGGVADTDTPDVSFNYDVSTANNAKNMLGRLASISSAHGSVFYSYTTNGQVKYKATTLPNNLCSFTVQTYSYDLLGNLVQASDDIGGSTIANIYDSAANPQQVQAAAGSSSLSPIVSGFNYDAYGITSLQFGNGWTGQMSYDARGRMNGFAAQSGGITQYGYNLNWNNNGSLASATDTANGSWSYSYDDFNRLVSATQNSGSPTTYQYDVFGNRYPINNGAGGSAIFTYDLHNHNSLFAYDENGNTVATPQVDSDFDAEGRVVRVRAHNGTTVIAAYVYGPEGDRILATRGSKVTEYFYGIGGDLRMTRINGAVAKVQVNTPVGQVGSFVSGAFQYEFHDWNGSSRMNVSSSGTILKTFQSDAFGANSNAATDDVAQVNALDVDAEAYSAHAGARDYYPSYGVWNAPDPFGGSYDFGDPQSLNRYAYVGNSPVSYNDPTGLARYANAPDAGVFSTNSPVYDDYLVTKPAGVSDNPIPWWLDLLRQGLGRLGSFIASGGSGSAAAGAMSGFNANPTQGEIDAGNAAEAWSRFAFATAGQMAFHPALQVSVSQRQTVSPQGQRFIKNNETLTGRPDLKVYGDTSGNPTIGFGHLVKSGDNFAGGITDIQAESMFQADLAKHTAIVTKLLLFAQLPQSKFDALVDVAFNSPRAASIIIATILLGDEPSYIGFLSTLPHPNAGLLNRRSDEFIYFRYGVAKKWNLFHTSNK